ncbi:MAG: hypothetical protein H6742_21360, partial [Alphaproteobacteria bacterium]|nr:hypothetical protein [Alphaproteobacteria bacterium]
MIPSSLQPVVIAVAATAAPLLVLVALGPLSRLRAPGALAAGILAIVGGIVGGVLAWHEVLVLPDLLGLQHEVL